MPAQDFLPSEAISELKRLMHLFKTTLNAQIQSFEHDGNVIELSRTTCTLRRDLIQFKENFEYWHQYADTAKKYQELDALAKELGEAQNLLCKAAELVKSAL